MATRAHPRVPPSKVVIANGMYGRMPGSKNFLSRNPAPNPRPRARISIAIRTARFAVYVPWRRESNATTGRKMLTQMFFMLAVPSGERIFLWLRNFPRQISKNTGTSVSRIIMN